MDASSPDMRAHLAAGVVSAFVAHNAVPAADLPGLVHKVHAAFSTLGQPAAAPATTAPKPAVPVKQSVNADYLVSLIDGKRYKSLKRHLTRYSHTPESYRAAFGLPADYPMTCKAYSERRADIAKQTGLGKSKVQAA